MGTFRSFNHLLWRGSSTMPESMEHYHPEDGCLISLRQPREVRYWSKRLGVSDAHLRLAVKAQGHGVKAVEAWLAANTP